MVHELATTILNYLYANQWALAYIAAIYAIGAIWVAKDLVCGIHWFVDITIVVVLIGFGLLLYID